MTVSLHYNIDQIAGICQATWINKNEAIPAPEYLSLDSRKINNPEKTIFLSLRSTAENVALFISELYKKGVRNFIVDQPVLNVNKYPEANILRVTNSVKALQDLAIYHRGEMKNMPVIGITGSNGKTVVKEWLNQLLSEDFVIARSPKSYNSQVGVPLSVLNILPGNNLGIFEAGISLPGEMVRLEKIIQPGIGIFTNLGNAHDEGFSDKKQKIKEKLLLFSGANLLITRADNKDILAEVFHFQKVHPTLKLLTWGWEADCELRLIKIKKENLPFQDLAHSNLENKLKFTQIEGTYLNKKYLINLPFHDEASIENAIHCLCCLLFLQKATPEILKRFETLEPLAMRLELKPAINHCTLINDSYSNDLQSLRIALDFLSQQKQHTRRTLIFSDIVQSGTDPAKLYGQVASLLRQYQVDQLIGIGPEISRHAGTFSFLKKSSFFENTPGFIKNLQLHSFRDESILIKGARKFEFEKISRLLETKIHQTVLSINLNNLVHNLKKYKEKLKPSTKIMVMVKASGYGSGSHEIASVLEYNKADYLAVAYTDEGVELRNAGISLPIMVMNIDESAFDLILTHNLEPEIFSFRILDSFLQYLKANEIKSYPVHLKIDTGMHRLGFMENEIQALASLLDNNNFIRIQSVFTHLAASDEESKDSFTLLQFQTFKRCTTSLEKILGYFFLKHVANTSAISRLPALQMDMVRLGIGLYGIDSNPGMQTELKNVTTLKTTISQIKNIPAGDTVGYGRNGKIMKDSRIATVRLGYADGYPRSLGNGQGNMLVANHLVPVIGNVCMDMTMLDVTGISGLEEGNEVIVFGERPSLQMLAAWADTIPYEIMTGISQRVKRVYFEE